MRSLILAVSILLVSLAVTGIQLVVATPGSPASSAGSLDSSGPAAAMLNVTTSAPKESGKSMISTKTASDVLLLSVSPDKKRLCYALQLDHGKTWECGIVDPCQSEAIRYSGSTSNGFCVIGMVWAPQSDEVALGLGYKTAIARWIRVGVAAPDQKAKGVCDEMASCPTAEVEEVVTKNTRSEWPVWGTNGRYYENQQLAEKDGSVTFQAGETRAAEEAASRVRLFGGEGSDYTVLTDNVAMTAHAFKDGRYVESFPLVGRTVQGWWILTRANGRLIGARQFAFAREDAIEPVNPAAPVQWKWAGVDLGVGTMLAVYRMDRGILLHIQRGNASEAVFIETRAVEHSLEAKK